MNDKKIFFDKLFPWKSGVNRNNILMNYDCVFFVTIPKDSEYISLCIENKMKKYNKNKKDICIIDSTACVGGDTITFSEHFGITIPIEIDETRFNYLKHNIELYNITNAYPIYGDCMEIIPDININIDVIYVDPPWGGSDYKNKNNITLKLGENELCDVIDNFMQKAKLTVIKLPKNYDYNTLKSNLKVYEIHHDTSLKKIDILFIEKKNY